MRFRTPTNLIEWLKSMSIYIVFSLIELANHINGCFSANDF